MPVKNTPNGSHVELFLAPADSPPTLDGPQPGPGSFSQQRYKHVTACDNARVVNGNIFYGKVVQHHLDAAAVSPPDVKASLVRTTKEEHQRVEEQRKLLEEAMASLLFPEVDFRYTSTKTAQLERCDWIFKTPEYVKWHHHDPRNGKHGCLWIKSKPAAGKSTIMKFAIKHAETEATQKAERLARKRIQQQRVEVRESDGMDMNAHFFFNARGSQLERSAEGMYRSLLHQLVTLHKDRKHRHWLTAHNKPTHVGWQWPLEVLQTTFEDGVLGIGDNRLTCYIDGIDECDEAQARDVVSLFERLLKQAAARGVRFRVCFASRHYPHISMDGSLQIVLEGEAGHQKDIERYISDRLRIDTADAPSIEADLRARAAGVFLWVVLAVKILNEESDRGRSYALRQRLGELPSGLNDLFQDILCPRGDDREEVVVILQWIMFASRPLRCRELYYAVRTSLERSAVLPMQDGNPSRKTMAKFILHASRGLAELTQGPSPVVQFVHESVRDFMFRKGSFQSLGADSVGQSHERLKICCQQYTFAANVNSNITLTPQELPLLRYAIHGILYHANAAHHGGVKQDSFVASLVPNRWMSMARLVDPGRYSNTPVDIVCIFAEAKVNHLLRLAVEQDGRFTRWPGRYIEYLGTIIPEQKPTRIELLLLDDQAEGYLEDKHLKALVDMSLNARYSLVTVLLLQHRWTGHIEDELCLKFLNWALTEKHLEVVDLLINHIAQLEGYAHSVLELAIEDGATTIVEMLLAKNTNSSFHERRHGRLLRTAVHLGHFSIAKMLLDRGVDPHFSSPRYGHLLWIAAKAGHSRIVELLYTKGAEVNRRAMEGRSTPLQAACFNRHVETVQALLQCGADVRASGAEYGTASEAAMYWPHADRAKEIVQMLHRHGAVM